MPEKQNQERVNWTAIGDRYKPLVPEVLDVCKAFDKTSGIWKVTFSFRDGVAKDLPLLLANTTPYDSQRENSSRQLAEFANIINDILSKGIPTNVRSDDPTPMRRAFKYRPLDFSPFMMK